MHLHWAHPSLWLGESYNSGHDKQLISQGHLMSSGSYQGSLASQDLLLTRSYFMKSICSVSNSQAPLLHSCQGWPQDPLGLPLCPLKHVDQITELFAHKPGQAGETVLFRDPLKFGILFILFSKFRVAIWIWHLLPQKFKEVCQTSCIFLSGRDTKCGNFFFTLKSRPHDCWKIQPDKRPLIFLRFYFLPLEGKYVYYWGTERPADSIVPDSISMMASI